MEQCPINYCPFDLGDHRPRILPACGHTVCNWCLMHPSFNMQCPLDRTEITTPIEQIPLNRAIMSFIAEGNTSSPAYYCRNHTSELEAGLHVFTPECVKMGHQPYPTQRDARAELVAEHEKALKQAVDATATLVGKLAAAAEDSGRRKKEASESMHRLDNALSTLRAYVEEGGPGLQPAREEARSLGAEAPQLLERALLMDQVDQCVLTVKAVDGSIWRAEVFGGRPPALLPVLMQLHAEGHLVKTSGPGLAAAAQAVRREIRNLRPHEMTDAEKVDLMRPESLREVRAVHGLDCTKSQNFCKLLLEDLAPQLETLSLRNASDEHLRLVGRMEHLLRFSLLLDVDADPRPFHELALPPKLVELDMNVCWPGDLRVIAQRSETLRELRVTCNHEAEPDARPELPLGLEVLAVTNATRQQLLCLPRMPRLRRLMLCGYVDDEAVDWASLPSWDCGLSWLRVHLSSRFERTLLSLVGAHAATLRWLFIGCDSLPAVGARTSDAYFSDLVVFLRCRCRLEALQRLVLVRGPSGGDGPLHTAESCRAQLAELRDAVLRKDAAGSTVAPPVTCSICNGEPCPDV